MQKILVHGLDDRHPHLRARVVWLARHPKPGSYFEQQMKLLPEMSDEDLPKELSKIGYNGIILAEGERATLMGEIYFQLLSNMEMHVFFCHVPEDFRGQDFGKLLFREFFIHADKCGCDVVRISEGGEGSEPLLHMLKLYISGVILLKGLRVVDASEKGIGYAKLEKVNQLLPA